MHLPFPVLVIPFGKLAFFFADISFSLKDFL